jgi:hypothetical protein
LIDEAHGEQVHPEGSKTVSSLAGVGAASASKKSPAPTASVPPVVPPLPGWQPPTLPAV